MKTISTITCGFIRCENEAAYVSVESLSAPVCKACVEAGKVKKYWHDAPLVTIDEWLSRCPRNVIHPPHVGCWGGPVRVTASGSKSVIRCC